VTLFLLRRRRVIAVIIMAQPVVLTVVVVEYVSAPRVLLVVAPVHLEPISLLRLLTHMFQEVGHVHVLIVRHIHRIAINVIQVVKMVELIILLNLLMLVQ
jgi:hypothetical protein